ncbi:MAG: glycosyltransferase family 2 protein [Cyclobacteriaceae bacterium]
MGEILFSVILPTYNRAHTIRKTLASLERQTFQEFEVIVVDDGSTDDTEAVVAGHHLDVTLRYLKQTNQGVSAARNYGAKDARGRFLVFLDSDDQMEPCYLAVISNIINRKEPVKFISCGVKIMQDGRETVFLPRMQPMYSGRSVNMLAGGFTISKDIFIAAGGYDPKIYFGENGELGLRIMRHVSSFELAFTDKIMLNIYVEGQLERRLRYNAWKELSSCERIIELHGDGLLANDRQFYVSMLSKISVAAIVGNDVAKSRWYAKKALWYGRSFKSFLRFLLVNLFPSWYRKLLVKKNYLP